MWLTRILLLHFSLSEGTGITFDFLQSFSLVFPMSSKTITGKSEVTMMNFILG